MTTGKKTAAAATVPLVRARALWLHKQGLPPRRAATAQEVLVATGWARTLGGVDVYLALRVRAPRLTGPPSTPR